MSEAPPPPPAGGMQPPAGGAGLPGPLASWGERAVAFLINGAVLFVGAIVVVIVGSVLGAASDALGALVMVVGYLVVIAGAFYFYFLEGETGASPGKRVTGLRTVNLTSGEVIGGGMGIVRYLAHFVDSLICYIGWLFPLWDEKRQTIADKIVGTVVVSGQPKQAFSADIFRR